MNTVQTRNQTRRQNEKMNNQSRYKDVTNSSEDEDEESDDEPPRREQKRKIIKNKTISVPTPGRKRGRPRKSTLKTMDDNKTKPQKKK